jgi:hypothetical protein
MINELKIAVIIPAYRVKKHIHDVVNNLPDFIDSIIVVDDKCPDNSGHHILEKNKNKKLIVEFHEKNKGVGGAVITGYKKAIEINSDIVVKMDGDDQMDPMFLPLLITSLTESNAGYSKGNRFNDFAALKSMPKIRLFGNSILSFLVKVCAGYWDIMDPTNGYTAIKIDVIKKLNFENISNRYFFETDMLINLNIRNIGIIDIPMPAKYGNEESSLNISNIIRKFPIQMLKGLIRRIFLKYFIYNFNMFSIYLISSFLFISWGIIFGGFHWYMNSIKNIQTPTGTIMLAILPLMLGIQFLLQALSIDIHSIPKVNFNDSSKSH